MNRKNFFIVIPLVLIAAYALFTAVLEDGTAIAGIVRILYSWVS